MAFRNCCTVALAATCPGTGPRDGPCLEPSGRGHGIDLCRGAVYTGVPVPRTGIRSVGTIRPVRTIRPRQNGVRGATSKRTARSRSLTSLRE
jgi:hypothetical protein